MLLQKDKNYSILNSVHIDKSFFLKYSGKTDPVFILIYIELLCVIDDRAELSYQDIADRLNIDVNKVKDGILYWVGQGLISIDAEVIKLFGIKSEKTPIKPDSPTIYSTKEIAKVVEADQELKVLYESTQKILGKMLSTADINTLFGLYDWLGLPISVIYILLEYCAENNKRNMKYIEKTAVSWAECGINTLDDAIVYVSRERDRKSYISEIRKILGISDRKITMLEQQNILKWQELGMAPEMVAHAYEITVNRTGKFAIQYMHKIILSWAQQDVKTIGQVKAKSNEYNNTKKENTAVGSNKKADFYDYDKIASNAAKRMLEKLKGKSE